MTINLFKAEDTLKLTLLITSVQVIISSLEGLYNYRIYKPHGLLSWNYVRQSKRIFIVNPFVKKIFDLLFNYPNFLMLICARMLITILMVISIIGGRKFNLEIDLIAVLTLLIGLRNTYSNNGSDQLTGIIITAMALTTLSPSSIIVQFAAIIFIAFQASLSYLTSGVYKFINVCWKNGEFLRGILSTEVFGNRTVKRIMDGIPNSYLIGSFVIIFGEIFLGICFLFPSHLCLLVLFTGILFHLSVALIMGLNTFLWTCGATYPSIYFVSLHYFSHII